MPEMKKHVGQINNTGRRCIVAFMQLPNDPEYALVIDSDALPERYHDAIMPVLESLEGQSEKDFASVLSRRIMSDTGSDMLTTLHQSGYLQRTHVSNITMLPLPNYPTPLTQLLGILDKPTETAVVPNKDADVRYNQHLANNAVDKEEALMGNAMNLIAFAKDLEAEAQKKREEAYRLCPSLRPTQTIQVPALYENKVETLEKPKATRGRKKASA